VKQEDISPATQPFTRAVEAGEYSEIIRSGALEANEAIDAAKRILLQNRVQNFQAADVVNVARLILNAGE